LNIQPETSIILSHDVMQQLSTLNASYLQSAIDRARATLNNEFQASIQKEFSPIERDIAKGDKEISRLTERLIGVSGRVEKRRIQAENRQNRSDIRQQYPTPSTTGLDWTLQLSREVSNKLSQDIGFEQQKVEQTAIKIIAQAQIKSWPILFDFVSHKLCAHADDKNISTLKNICVHIANHQQSLSELKQLQSDLSNMRAQVNQDETEVRLLLEKIGLNKKQIDRNKLCITNEQETI